MYVHTYMVFVCVCAYEHMQVCKCTYDTHMCVRMYIHINIVIYVCTMCTQQHIVMVDLCMYKGVWTLCMYM